MDARDPRGNERRSSRNVAGTVEQLRQQECARTRSNAITTFCRGLRRGPLFQSFWDGIGGAVGLANLMTEFSLRDVKALCRHLGATASAHNARPERHASLTELVRLLDEGGPVKKDPRPLRQHYQNIVPACGLELVQEWDDGGWAEWTKFQRVCLFGSYREWYQGRFLKDITSPVRPVQRTTFSAESRLFHADLGFSEAILSTLIADKKADSPIPRDFMSAFVTPLLQRLVRRQRYDDETRDRFLNLVVRCIEVHASELTRYHRDDLEELLCYAIQRWSVARIQGVRTATAATRRQTEVCLQRLIELMPLWFNQLGSLRGIFNGLLLHREKHVESYQLLRLILRHARGYKLDIDGDSTGALSRLNDLARQRDLWPMGLFVYLNVEDALGLFERLSTANPTGNFLDTEMSSRSSSLRTVLQQRQHPGTDRGDAEIVRYILHVKSKNSGVDVPAWLERARALIHERRKKSEEGRTWQLREFWAKSAVSLCVASGDMEMLDDTILWARRFNNQALVARGLYSSSSFGTQEMRDLLSAVPAKDKDVQDPPSDRAAAKAIETSSRILVHLMQTIKMSSSQPQTEIENWQTLLRLPKLVVDHRLTDENVASFDALFEGNGAVEKVWKPTIDALVMVEGLLSESQRVSVKIKGYYVIQELPGISGKVMADLTSFFFERIKVHLGSEWLWQRMQTVVDLVTDVAESNQPWLASTFIRDLVLDGEGANSAWHRSLLSFRFLSSLPYKAASNLLYTMVEGAREKMREQNVRSREDTGSSDGEAAVRRPPAIKITTIKMMAQLLQECEIIGDSAACDMLLGLLAEARHIDTLVVIVSSLFSILRRPAALPEIHTRILDALEESLSPVLPQLSQRRPLSEADWAAVESGQAELPDVADEAPLTSLLISQARDSEDMPPVARARIIELLVRVPAQSALQNSRWNKLFLARNGFSLDESEHLPAAPAFLVTSLLSGFSSYVPVSMLTMLRDLALINLDPTPLIMRVNEAVKSDRDLVNSNAGKHWLAQFDNSGPEVLSKFGLLMVASLLCRDLPASERDDGEGVTVQLLKESVLAIADRIIACQVPDMLYSLVAHLTSGRHASRTKWLAWREHCLPVVGSIAAKIDELRSKGAPVHGLLPSLFLLQLRVLPVPYSKPPKEPAPAEELDVFVTELSRLVDWLVQRGLPYHDEFEQLKSNLRSDLERGDYARVALLLGGLDGGAEGLGGKGAQDPTLAGYLRLELAGYLLIEAGDSIDECSGVLPAIKHMVREWVSSDDEFVRVTGMGVEKKHKSLFP